MDALQVFVRGFEDRQRAGAIRNRLTALGFQIEECFDGESDSLGGLIETNIVPQDNLDESDPDVILSMLREATGYDGLWLQTREFQLKDDGEYGRDGVKEAGV